MRAAYYLTVFAAAGCFWLAGCPAEDEGDDTGDQPVDVLVGDDGAGQDDSAVVDQDTAVEEDVSVPTPSIVGTWDMESSFGLFYNLPPTAETVLNVAVGLLNSPSGQLLMLMCDPVMLGLSTPTDFCSRVFNNPSVPAMNDLTDFGTFVRGEIDANTTQMLTAACPTTDQPDLCNGVYYTLNDLTALSEQVGFGSTMTCTANPDESGEVPAGTCTENWHTVKYRWLVGAECDPAIDANCGVVVISMAAIPGIGQAVGGDVTGSVSSGGDLAIDSHLVTLKPGALIQFALQQIAIPRLFGDGSDGLPVVDSYAELFGAMLGARQCLEGVSCCAGFESAVLAQYPETPAGIATAACEFATDTVATYLMDHIAAIDASGGVWIGTPAGTPAMITDLDDDGTYDAIGTAEEPAMWDGVLQLGGFDYEFDGNFWGMRD